MRWLSFVLAAFLVAGIGCSGKDKQKDEVKGTEGKKLGLTAPGETTIKQDGEEKITVKIKREKFDDTVDLTFSDLPDGISLKDKNPKIAKGSESETFVLVAAKDAKPKEGHKAKVSASYGDMKVGPFEFTINVKEKK